MIKRHWKYEFNDAYINRYQKNIKSSFLKWNYLFDSGLSRDEGKNRHEQQYYTKIRSYFNNTKKIIYNSEDLTFFLIEKGFEPKYALDLSDLAYSNNIKLIDTFVKEIEQSISIKNTSLDYYTSKGWDNETAKKKLKEFFKAGNESTNKKRNDFLYDEWYKNTRKPGGNAAYTKNSEMKKSLMEKQIEEKLKEGGFNIKKFYSPCVYPQLNQIYNKKNFIHDIYVNDKYIIEYNGIYWHKDFISFPEKFSKDDYMYEIKKAYNCLELIKRKNAVKYIIIWENDLSNIDDIIAFLEKCFTSNDKNNFFSTRHIDLQYYDEFVKEEEKQHKANLLFKDMVIRLSDESHCQSKRVASLAVKNFRIIATGINGTPEGFINCDEYFKSEYIEQKIQIPYDEWIKTDDWRKQHHEWSTNNELHSEQSLVCESCRNGINLTNVDIYVSLEPCIHCAKLIVGLKPRHVYYVNDYDKSTIFVKKILNQNNIILEKI